MYYVVFFFFNRECYYPNDPCSNAMIEQFGRVGEVEDGEIIMFQSFKEKN